MEVRSLERKTLATALYGGRINLRGINELLTPAGKAQQGQKFQLSVLNIFI
jgi:hypothetical protein